MDLLPIQTARLVLRRFIPKDLESFQAYRSDPVLARYQGWEPMPDEQARSFLAGQARQALGAAGQWLQVAVTRRETGEVIGDLGLCVVDESEGVVELGFTVAQWAQRRGYATEAVNAMLEALLGQRSVQSVMAVTDARNTASVALLRRVGFRHERTTTTIFRGEPCQEQTFVLTKRQWASEHAG
jgi:RimJ/RimL family protein N-acetyltransferase